MWKTNIHSKWSKRLIKICKYQYIYTNWQNYILQVIQEFWKYFLKCHLEKQAKDLWENILVYFHEKCRISPARPFTCTNKFSHFVTLVVFSKLLDNLMYILHFHTSSQVTSILDAPRRETKQNKEAYWIFFFLDIYLIQGANGWDLTVWRWHTGNNFPGGGSVLSPNLIEGHNIKKLNTTYIMNIYD